MVETIKIIEIKKSLSLEFVSIKNQNEEEGRRKTDLGFKSLVIPNRSRCFMKSAKLGTIK